MVKLVVVTAALLVAIGCSKKDAFISREEPLETALPVWKAAKLQADLFGRVSRQRLSESQGKAIMVHAFEHRFSSGDQNVEMFTRPISREAFALAQKEIDDQIVEIAKNVEPTEKSKKLSRQLGSKLDDRPREKLERKIAYSKMREQDWDEYADKRWKELLKKLQKPLQLALLEKVQRVK